MPIPVMMTVIVKSGPHVAVHTTFCTRDEADRMRQALRAQFQDGDRLTKVHVFAVNREAL